MRRFLKKKTVWLTVVAVALAGSMTIHSAIAYFTTYATASGSHPISIGSKTEIVEEFDNWTKHIQIQNTGENECFVRVKVFCGSQFTVQFSGEAGAWEERDGDGYWYYNVQWLQFLFIIFCRKKNLHVLILLDCLNLFIHLVAVIPYLLIVKTYLSEQFIKQVVLFRPL